MALADSKIFKGDDATLDPTKPIRKERRIFVCVPAAYVDGTQAPVIDGTVDDAEWPGSGCCSHNGVNAARQYRPFGRY